jgi:hypothetical protein
MHRRDSEKAGGRLIALMTVGCLAAGLSACANAGPHSAEGPYPKFSDIPLKAGPTTASSQSEANMAILRGMGEQLAAQAQGISSTPSDSESLAAARATAGQVKTPTDADAAATQAFLRAARARATPPPLRK